MEGFITPRVEGIQIVPDEDVAPGCKRTDPYGCVIVNPNDYRLMRPMPPRSVLVALAMLQEEFQDEVVEGSIVKEQEASEG